MCVYVCVSMSVKAFGEEMILGMPCKGGLSGGIEKNGIPGRERHIRKATLFEGIVCHSVWLVD